MSVQARVKREGGWPTSTSASGPMDIRGMMADLLLAGSLLIEGTAAQCLLARDWENVLVPFPQTGTGREPVDQGSEPKSTGSAIMELRRLSGLTWEQLAVLFGVARRSLHFWANGKRLNAANEEHLRRLLSAIRKTDRGTAEKNRAILLEDRDGAVPLALLSRGAYDEFITLVGVGTGRRQLKPAPLSQGAWEVRKPQLPEELVGALQDRIHRDVGKARPGRAVKIKK